VQSDLSQSCIALVSDSNEEPSKHHNRKPRSNTNVLADPSPTINVPGTSSSILSPHDIQDLKVGVVNQHVTTWAKNLWRDCQPHPDFQKLQGVCSVPRNAECMIQTPQDVNVIDVLEIFAVHVEAAAPLTGGDQCNDVGLPDRMGLMAHCTNCTAVHQWKVSTCRLILIPGGWH
jgi:hypothetical protein